MKGFRKRWSFFYNERLFSSSRYAAIVFYHITLDGNSGILWILKKNLQMHYSLTLTFFANWVVVPDYSQEKKWNEETIYSRNLRSNTKPNTTSQSKNENKNAIFQIFKRWNQFFRICVLVYSTEMRGKDQYNRLILFRNQWYIKYFWKIVLQK